MRLLHLWRLVFSEKNRFFPSLFWGKWWEDLKIVPFYTENHLNQSILICPGGEQIHAAVKKTDPTKILLSYPPRIQRYLMIFNAPQTYSTHPRSTKENIARISGWEKNHSDWNAWAPNRRYSVQEILLFQGNPGWWNVTVWPDSRCACCTFTAFHFFGPPMKSPRYAYDLAPWTVPLAGLQFPKAASLQQHFLKLTDQNPCNFLLKSVPEIRGHDQNANFQAGR